MEFCQEQILSTGLLNPQFAVKAINIAHELEHNFSSILPRPFLWDASERNVLVNRGKITGIVDVDEVCFGDPLLVIALTSTCLELEGLDTEYTNYWEIGLELDSSAQIRLNFYKLFYAVAFMRKHSLKTENNKQIMFDTKKLEKIFYQSLARLNQ